eukprot:m.87814 g.87814  ORF g.87814 m.87814 type:complete len:418 (-) comp13129_c2_seq8:96-1349(-)
MVAWEALGGLVLLIFFILYVLYTTKSTQPVRLKNQPTLPGHISLSTFPQPIRSSLGTVNNNNQGEWRSFSDGDGARCQDAVYIHGKRRKLPETASLYMKKEDPEVVEGRAGFVKLDVRGQWGNHLGQYAVARIVAEELNFGLRVAHSMLDANWKKGHIFPDVVNLEAALTDKDLQALPTRTFGKHSYDVKAILADSTPRLLHMFGYPFEDFWVFGKYRDRIRDIFSINTGCIYWNQSYPGEHDIVVHLRSYKSCEPEDGEANVFTPTDSFADPPLQYYKTILDKMIKTQPKEGVIWLAARCGKEDSIAVSLQKLYGAQFTPTTTIHNDMADFIFMAASTRLIMAQSTFSWWAAYLGGGRQEVHYPLVGEWWGMRPRHRLYPDESRYVFHDLYKKPFRMFLTRSEIQSDIDNQKPPYM